MNSNQSTNSQSPFYNVQARKAPLRYLSLGVSLGLTMFVLIVTIGCAGYQLGNRSLYRADIRTIHVPIIRSTSFRPDLGVRLTEAVQKRIEERTPFKLADLSSADSILECTVTSDAKQVVTETNTDEPRLLKTTLTLEARWTDRRGGLLMENRTLPPGETAFFFAQGVQLVPEAGQSITTAQQRAIERLADHIVDQMESRW